MSTVPQEDVDELRAFLQAQEGTDRHLCDEHLAEAVRDARARVGGRRWSWKVLAREALRQRIKRA
jgi:hypothetical protein